MTLFCLNLIKEHNKSSSSSCEPITTSIKTKIDHTLCAIMINEKITASGQRGMYRDTEEHNDEV